MKGCCGMDCKLREKLYPRLHCIARVGFTAMLRCDVTLLFVLPCLTCYVIPTSSERHASQGSQVSQCSGIAVYDYSITYLGPK